ncbi:MAG: trypsin-like peptidase domain-containing protein [Pseudomonadales bacterium]
MFNVFRFLAWPVICGVLIATIVLLEYPETFGVARSASGNSAPVASFAEAVNKAAPAVVNIYTRKALIRDNPLLEDPFFRNFFKNNETTEPEDQGESLGSGVIIDPQGYLLTNNHVVAGADEIVVSLYDGRETLATVVGIDRETDLAVLKIDLPDIKVVTFGDPNAARVGDVVLAIGNPYGFGQSVTQGIISATGRFGLNINTYENYLQTDADINPGNSGGALIDAQGNLLGINSAIFSRSGGSQGIGLAIPVDLAHKVMQDIIKHGRVIRGWLGLEVRQFNPAYAAEFGNTELNGVIITGLYRGGPADSAGLQPGDVITHIDSTSISDGRSGSLRVADMPPGGEISVRVWRDDRYIDIQVLVGTRPEQGV